MVVVTNTGLAIISNKPAFPANTELKDRLANAVLVVAVLVADSY